MSLTNMVIMPREDYQDACDAVREKTGGTEVIKSGELGELIRNIKSGGSDDNFDWVIGDGNTHIWVNLPEGRVTPTLQFGVNGTATIDWGDGTEPDTVVGTNANTYGYNVSHEYANHGEHVISISCEGTLGFSGRYTSCILSGVESSSNIQLVYRNSICKIEFGDSVLIDNYACGSCYSLTDVVVSNGTTAIGFEAFGNCYALRNVILPDSMVTINGYVFKNCYSLYSVKMPKEVTTIDQSVFQSCYSLNEVVIPNGVTKIDNTFKDCRSLKKVTLPEGLTTITGTVTFYDCGVLSAIYMPSTVETIAAGAFSSVYGTAFLDFSKHSFVPTLSNTGFTNWIPEIRVPAALVDEWKAATNWSTYAIKIVGV